MSWEGRGGEEVVATMGIKVLALLGILKLCSQLDNLCFKLLPGNQNEITLIHTTTDPIATITDHH